MAEQRLRHAPEFEAFRYEGEYRNSESFQDEDSEPSNELDRDVVEHSELNTASPLYDEDRITWANPPPPLVFGPYGSGRQGPGMSQADYDDSAPIYDYEGTYNRRTRSSRPTDYGGRDPNKNSGGEGGPPGPWVCCMCGKIDDPEHILKSFVRIPIQAQPGLTRRISPMETLQTYTIDCTRCSHCRCQSCKRVDGNDSQSPSEQPAAAGDSSSWTSWFKSKTRA